MLKLEGVSIAYDGSNVIRDVSLRLEAGQIGSLLGPSGCGKSSLLRAVAGFVAVASGVIALRGEPVSGQNMSVAPSRRGVGLVFQDFALFPHLTVAENIAFGLKKWSERERLVRIESVLSLLKIESLGASYSHQLSGGQQQRVAIARAIAPKPDVLLLDEPFSSLDAELRAELVHEIKAVVQTEGMTALLVTHDQQEAFAFADVMGVISDGKLHQWGSAYDLYHRPASRFVADFIGEGVFVSATYRPPKKIQTPLGELCCLEPTVIDRIAQESRPLEVLIRPDDIIHDDDSPYTATVKSRAFRGTHFMYQLQVAELQDTVLLCLAPSHHDHAVGSAFGIRLALDHLIVFPVE